MGKNKAQRTKNNAKPSNSSRSAELLGTSIPNFVGFSAVKDGGYVPVLPGLAISAINEVEINTIDPNFQMVFKKMNKKDPTTKFKALQEFGDLCKDSPQSSVEAVLSFWPRLYAALSVDIEHRVREAAQLGHAALVKRVGRSIASYLKQLAGPWFTSQFDTYPPAASAAINSFQTTFPQKKIVDAIVHCQEEILSYICDNITVQTPQLLNTHKMLTPEELETKYQRLVISSLQGYATYLSKVSQQQIEKTLKIHQQIISCQKFWKLGKHENVLIKTGFFNVLTSIMENYPQLLKEERKRTMTTIMNSLDETEPGLLSAVWECALVAIDKTEDWHSFVSIEKLVLPKLWKVLRNGGQGCASVIYPSLLPFLSQFPKFNLNDKKQLFINFFENMRIGFSVKTVLISRSEMMAITKSFVECLKYAILLNNTELELCENLVKMQLLPVIETFIRDYSPVKSILFPEVTLLIRYWSKNRNSYDILVKIFWSEVESMFERLTGTETFDREAIRCIQDAEMKFLVALKNPSSPPRKNIHVKFADSKTGTGTETPDQSAVSCQSVEDDKLFLAELEQFVNKLCISYIKNIDDEEGNKNTNIVHLNRVVSYFESEELFRSLARAQRSDANFLDFYNKSLKSWIDKRPEEAEAVVQFVFTLLKYLNEEEKEIVLNSLREFDDSVLNYSVSCALKKENRIDKLIKNWLSESHVTQHLISIAKKFVQNSDNSGEKLLSLAFESSATGELSVGEEAIDGISNVLCQALINESLTQQSDTIFTNIVQLIVTLLKLTWNHKKSTEGSLILLKSLFELTIKDHPNCGDLKGLITDTWKEGFLRLQEKLTSERSFDILSKIKKNSLNTIYDHIYALNEGEIQEMIELALTFLESSNNYEYLEALEIIVEFNLEEKNKLFTEWIPQVTDLILHGEIISGNFYIENPLESIGLCEDQVVLILPEKEKTPDKTLPCLQWSLFTSKLISQIISKIAEQEIDEIDLAFSQDSLNCQLANILNSLILITSLGKLFKNHYRYSKNYDAILELHEKLEEEILHLHNQTPVLIWSKILQPADVKTLWTEFGSIFSEFLRYYNGNESHLSKVKSTSLEFFQNYLASCDSEGKKAVSHQLNAVIVARALLIEDGKQHSSDILEFVKHLVKLNGRQNFLTDAENGIDVSTLELSDFYLRLEVIRLFAKVVRTMPGELETVLWDAVTVCLSSWIVSLNKSKENHQDIRVRCFAAAVSDLFCEVQSVINTHKTNPISGIPPMLVDEWRDVFAEDVHKNILGIFVYLSKLLNEKSDELTPILALNYLGKTLDMHLEAEIFFDSKSNKSNQLIDLGLNLFSSPVTSLQLSAFYLLKSMIPKLVEEDKLLIENETFDCNNLNLKKYEATLLNTQKIVNAMLMDFRLCDTVSCVIQVHTDAYTYTLAYLLEWMIVLEMCALAHADLRYQYAELLKDELFPSLMNNVFRLMPVEVLQENKSKNLVSQLMELFRNEPKLELGMSLTEIKLENIVCWIYINCLRHLPVLARQWWSTTESRVSTAVDRITTLYASPILCQEELSNRQRLNNDIGNLQVKVQPNARAVVALYEMDDTKLELSMVLPVNHPLGLVTVEPGQHAGGAANWRNCHMQLSIFLTHQNGSIWDGLLMWQKNLDKKFAGVEECYICFSIFHINTYQIPKLSCHTCRKKFHAPCLYKWFSTSQKATCPICRNIF